MTSDLFDLIIFNFSFYVNNRLLTVKLILNDWSHLCLDKISINPITFC